MPYNGVGQFTSLGAPTFPAVSGDYILASYFNATMNDLFLGLTTALPRDGQAAMTAALPMGGFKVTGLGPGSASGDAVNYGQVFNNGSFTSPIFLGNANAAGATTFTVPTVAPGDNTTNAASTAFVQAAAFATALPSQVGNSGKFVTTNGVSASWADPLPSKTGVPSGSSLTVSSTGTNAWSMPVPQFLFNNLGVI